MTGEDKRDAAIARLQETYRQFANRERDLADEVAQYGGGADDPLHPPTSGNQFRDWQDFVDRVARPMVETANGSAVTAAQGAAIMQQAMKLYRTVSPYYICVAMVMMDNRIKTMNSTSTGEMND